MMTDRPRITKAASPIQQGCNHVGVTGKLCHEIIGKLGAVAGDTIREAGPPIHLAAINGAAALDVPLGRPMRLPSEGGCDVAHVVEALKMAGTRDPWATRSSASPVIRARTSPRPSPPDRCRSPAWICMPSASSATATTRRSWRTNRPWSVPAIWDDQLRVLESAVLGCVAPNVVAIEDTRVASPVVDPPLVLRDGGFHYEDHPGLGIRIDEDAWRRECLPRARVVEA